MAEVALLGRERETMTTDEIEDINSVVRPDEDLMSEYLDRKDMETILEFEAELAAMAPPPEESPAVESPPSSEPSRPESGAFTTLPGGMGGILPVGSGFEGEIAESVMNTIMESLPQIPGGVLEAGQNALKSLAEFNRSFSGVPELLLELRSILMGQPTNFDLPANPLPEVTSSALEMAAEAIPQIEPSTAPVPNLVRGAARFTAAFLPTLGALRIMGVTGPVLSGALAGVPADVLTVGEGDPNISALLEELDPSLRDSVLTLLATDPNDNEALNRFRTAVEGLLIGGALDITLRALSRSFVSTADAIRQSGVGLDATPQEVGEALREQIPNLFRSDVQVLPFNEPVAMGSDLAVRIGDAIEQTIPDDLAPDRLDEVLDLARDLQTASESSASAGDVLARLEAELGPEQTDEVLARAGLDVESPIDPESGDMVAENLALFRELSEPGRPRSLRSHLDDGSIDADDLESARELVRVRIGRTEMSEELRRSFEFLLDGAEEVDTLARIDQDLDMFPGRERLRAEEPVSEAQAGADPIQSDMSLEEVDAWREALKTRIRVSSLTEGERNRLLVDADQAIRNVRELADVQRRFEQALGGTQRGRPTVRDILRNERGALGRPDAGGLEAMRRRVLERLDPLDIPSDEKIRLAQAIHEAPDERVLGQIDQVLGRLEDIVSRRPERLEAVSAIDREPTVREGAEGVEIAAQRRPIPLNRLPDTEIELQEFIRRNGGIRLAGEELVGELSRLISPRALGRNPRLQNNASGITLQEMAERANEAGFTRTADKTSLLEALDLSRNRRPVFSDRRSGFVDVLADSQTRQVYQNLIEVVGDFQGRVGEARRAPEGQPRRRDFVHAEARELVDSGAFSRADVLALKPGAILNDTETSALVQVMADAAVEVQRLSDAYIDSGLVVGSPEGRRFAFMLGLLAELEPRRQGVLAEAGRTLGILNDPLSSANRFIRGFQSIFEAAPDQTMATIARRVSALPRLDQVARYSVVVGDAMASGRLADPVRAPRILLEYWVNALLSGPQTHAVNMLSNSLMIPGAMFERLLAANVPGSGIPHREAVYMAWGACQGACDAFRYLREGLAERISTAGQEGLRSLTRERRSRFAREQVDITGTLAAELGTEEKFVLNQGRAALTGENVAAKLQRVPGLSSLGERMAKNIAVNNSYFGTGIDVLGELMRTPTRTLGASDDMFKAINYRMQVHALALRHAYVEEGLRGRALRDRVAQLSNMPDEEVAARIDTLARDFAAVQTFTNALGPGGQAAQLMVGRVPIMRAIVPFMKTPINLFTQAQRRTPGLNLLSSTFRDDLFAGGERRAMALAQMGVGVTTLMAAYGLVLSGRCTGGGPRHFGLQQQLKSEGWQPYSCRIGGEWVSYNRLDPVMMPFAFMADFTELIANSEPDERFDWDSLAINGVVAIKDNYLSKTYVRGVADAVTAISPVHPSGEAVVGGVERFGRNMFRSLIPAIVRQREGVVDPAVREVYDWIDLWRSQIPGLSADLPARRNLWGEPIYIHAGLGPDFISPLYTTSGEASVATQILAEVDYPVRLPPKKVAFSGLNERIPLNAKEHEAFMMWSAGRNVDGSRLQGRDTLEQRIEQLQQSPGFRNGTAEQRRDLIGDRISAYRNRAKDMLLMEFDRVRLKYDEIAEKQRLEGIPRRNELLRRQLRIESRGRGVEVGVP